MWSSDQRLLKDIRSSTVLVWFKLVQTGSLDRYGLVGTGWASLDWFLTGMDLLRLVGPVWTGSGPVWSSWDWLGRFGLVLDRYGLVGTGWASLDRFWTGMDLLGLVGPV